MKVFIKLDNLNNLPQICQLDLAQIMWEKGQTFSRCGDDIYINRCTQLSLSWDKWLDDIRWHNNPKSKEYINFEYDAANRLLVIEIESDSLVVDKRAFHKAILFISQAIQSKISFDGDEWMDTEEYSKRFAYILNMNFIESVDLSLTIE